MVTTTTGQTGSKENQAELKEDLQKSGEQLSQAMKDTGKDASKEAKTKAEGAKDYAADELGELSDATEAAAQALNDNHHEKLSSYVGEIAGYVDGMANSLRHKSADDLMHDANHMARDNPALFIAGSVAIGLGIARLAKSGLQHGSQKDVTQHARQASPGSENSQKSSDNLHNVSADLNRESASLNQESTSARQGMNSGIGDSSSADTYGSKSYSSSPDLRNPKAGRPSTNI